MMHRQRRRALNAWRDGCASRERCLGLMHQGVAALVFHERARAMNTWVEATESARARLRRLSVACGEWRGAAPYVRPSKCLAIIDTGHASTTPSAACTGGGGVSEHSISSVKNSELSMVPSPEGSRGTGGNSPFTKTILSRIRERRS